MKNAGAIRLLLLAGLTLPAACSSNVSFSLPSLSSKTTTPNNDLPAAQDLDAANTRKLFLIVVDGLRKQGRSRAALAFLDDYNKQFPNDRDAMLLQAECLLDTGAYDQAKPIYAALLTGPKSAAAYAGLGDIAAARHDWPDATAQFEEATRRDPSNAAYVNDLGFALVHTGQYDRGLAKLQQATQLDPASRVMRNNLILGMALAGRTDEANQLLGTITDPKDRDNASQLLHVTTAANDRAPRAAASTIQE
jgi:tetratricopeptide (TPR) repeat protein